MQVEKENNDRAVSSIKHLTYLKSRNFREDKFSRISRILSKFAKLNPREIFPNGWFAKINPREIFKICKFAKINPREIKKKKNFSLSLY